MGLQGDQTRLDPERHVHRGQPVDHVLPSRAVVGSIGELALDIAQAGCGSAPERFQARHAVERNLDRPRHQAFHLLGAGARVLRDHLDQGRCRVGIGFDIQVQGRVNPRPDQGKHADHDDQTIMQTPGDDRANQRVYPREAENGSEPNRGGVTIPSYSTPLARA